MIGEYIYVIFLIDVEKFFIKFIINFLKLIIKIRKEL